MVVQFNFSTSVPLLFVVCGGLNSDEMNHLKVRFLSGSYSVGVNDGAGYISWKFLLHAANNTRSIDIGRLSVRSCWYTTHNTVYTKYNTRFVEDARMRPATLVMDEMLDGELSSMLDAQRIAVWRHGFCFPHAVIQSAFAGGEKRNVRKRVFSCLSSCRRCRATNNIAIAFVFCLTALLALVVLHEQYASKLDFGESISIVYCDNIQCAIWSTACDDTKWWTGMDGRRVASDIEKQNCIIWNENVVSLCQPHTQLLWNEWWMKMYSIVFLLANHVYIRGRSYLAVSSIVRIMKFDFNWVFENISANDTIFIKPFLLLIQRQIARGAFRKRWR